jgi:hypothetical protein
MAVNPLVGGSNGPFRTDGFQVRELSADLQTA